MTSRTSTTIRLLITDIDNTLYDWVNIWFRSFNAMIETASTLSGVPRRTLEEEALAVHRRYRTPEYSHLLQELPALQALDDGEPGSSDVIASSIDAFRRARADAMSLYPGVRESLVRIQNAGCPIVAYTETSAFYTAMRLRWLELDGVLNTVYSPPDHDFGNGVTPSSMRRRPDSEYPLQRTAHHFTPAHHYKPDTSVLRSILEEFSVQPSEVLYVGDSLAKDIVMAQKVGVNDAHAAYGLAQTRPEYELLRRVSHWTDEDIERERQLLDRPTVTPSVSLNEFSEIFQFFTFGNGMSAPPDHDSLGHIS